MAAQYRKQIERAHGKTEFGRQGYSPPRADRCAKKEKAGCAEKRQERRCR